MAKWRDLDIDEMERLIKGENNELLVDMQARGWSSVAELYIDQRIQLEDLLSTLEEKWDSEAGRAYRAAMEKLKTAINEEANRAIGNATALRNIGAYIGGAQDTIERIRSDLDAEMERQTATYHSNLSWAQENGYKPEDWDKAWYWDRPIELGWHDKPVEPDRAKIAEEKGFNTRGKTAMDRMTTDIWDQYVQHFHKPQPESYSFPKNAEVYTPRPPGAPGAPSVPGAPGAPAAPATPSAPAAPTPPTVPAVGPPPTAQITPPIATPTPPPVTTPPQVTPPVVPAAPVAPAAPVGRGIGTTRPTGASRPVSPTTPAAPRAPGMGPAPGKPPAGKMAPPPSTMGPKGAAKPAKPGKPAGPGRPNVPAGPAGKPGAGKMAPPPSAMGPKGGQPKPVKPAGPAKPGKPGMSVPPGGPGKQNAAGKPLPGRQSPVGGPGAPGHPGKPASLPGKPKGPQRMSPTLGAPPASRRNDPPGRKVPPGALPGGPRVTRPGATKPLLDSRTPRPPAVQRPAHFGIPPSLRGGANKPLAPVKGDGQRGVIKPAAETTENRPTWTPERSAERRRKNPAAGEYAEMLWDLVNKPQPVIAPTAQPQTSHGPGPAIGLR